MALEVILSIASAAGKWMAGAGVPYKLLLRIYYDDVEEKKLAASQPWLAE